MESQEPVSPVGKAKWAATMLALCGRCTRRRMTSRCNDTRETAEMALPSSAQTNLQLVSPSSKRLICSSYDLGADDKLPPSIGSSVTARGTSRRGLFKRTTGSQGSISFSAIFAEDQKQFHLGTSKVEKETDPISESGLQHPLLREDREASVNADLALGIKALFNLPTRKFCHKLMESFDILHETPLVEPLITKGVHSLWSTFGDCLAEPRTKAKVYPIVEKLCENALSPPHLDSEDATD
jgi:hypothetical protein